jgi:hypothetical protein
MAVNSNGMGLPFLYRNGVMTDPGAASGWGLTWQGGRVRHTMRWPMWFSRKADS